MRASNGSRCDTTANQDRAGGIPQFINVEVDFFAYASITSGDLASGTAWTHSDPDSGDHGGQMVALDSIGDQNLRYRHRSWLARGVETGTPGKAWADSVLGSVTQPTQAQNLSPAPCWSSGGKFSETTSVRGYAVTSELTMCHCDVGGGLQFID